MKVVEVEWLSREANESVLLLSDGNVELPVFCHPFKGQKGDTLAGELHAFEVSEVVSVKDSTSQVIIAPDGLAVRAIAQVLSVSDNTVEIGEFVVELDELLPKDVGRGDWVEFSCDRLDYW